MVIKNKCLEYIDTLIAIVESEYTKIKSEYNSEKNRLKSKILSIPTEKKYERIPLIQKSKLLTFQSNSILKKKSKEIEYLKNMRSKLEKDDDYFRNLNYNYYKIVQNIQHVYQNFTRNKTYELY